MKISAWVLWVGVASASLEEGARYVTYCQDTMVQFAWSVNSRHGLGQLPAGVDSAKSGSLVWKHAEAAAYANSCAFCNCVAWGRLCHTSIPLPSPPLRGPICRQDRARGVGRPTWDDTYRPAGQSPCRAVKGDAKRGSGSCTRQDSMYCASLSLCFSLSLSLLASLPFLRSWDEGQSAPGRGPRMYLVGLQVATNNKLPVESGAGPRQHFDA